MAQIKWELEDMAFKYLEPEAYWWLVEQIAEQRPRRERYVREAGELLRAELLAHGVKAEVTGRAKHLYSIYRKLLRPEINMDLQRVYDLFALRVLVDTLPACYQALGQVHALWTPVNGRFKDYIATPKPNGYQSLHTTVIGLDGRQLEAQIHPRDAPPGRIWHGGPPLLQGGRLGYPHVASPHTCGGSWIGRLALAHVSNPCHQSQPV
jgi:GTP pyrophosphokinase